MAIKGLIIPRSYNDYFSRSNPQELASALIDDNNTSSVKTFSSNKLQNSITEIESDVAEIEEKIPAQASAQNQLADKNFVNSTVGTNTANYISDDGEPFTSVADLEAYSGTVTNNDYAFVTGTDSDGNTYFDRYKATVSGDVVTWAKEYRLNNSSFTASQWAAINSGITAALVAQIGQGGAGDATPIGAIIPYGGANAPSGYIICDGRAVSRTDYDKLFEKIGTTFGNGDGTTTFNVPDLRDKFAQGANGNLGESIEAGIPNIKGQVLSATWPDSSGDGNESGAFYDDGTDNYGANGNDARRIAKFDASRYNSVYSDSVDTVQPPAVAVNFIIKASASTGEIASDVELDDDATTTANVWSASKTHDEIENAAANIVTFGSNANGSYRIWSNGFVEMWGLALHSNSRVTVTYPIPLSEVVNISLKQISENDSGTTTHEILNSYTTTECVISNGQYSTSSSSLRNDCFWSVCGWKANDE